MSLIYHDRLPSPQKEGILAGSCSGYGTDHDQKPFPRVKHGLRGKPLKETSKMKPPGASFQKIEVAAWGYGKGTRLASVEYEISALRSAPPIHSSRSWYDAIGWLVAQQPRNVINHTIYDRFRSNSFHHSRALLQELILKTKHLYNADSPQ